ncbi:MAG TPA: hypothetical protein VK635_27775 [Bradyrhizobium sp.]|jgi:hypothetical protein|nr:hypothetical protein [Bradyrhizobium sp.]
MAGHDEKKNKKAGSNPGLLLFRAAQLSLPTSSSAKADDPVFRVFSIPSLGAAYWPPSRA